MSLRRELPREAAPGAQGGGDNWNQGLVMGNKLGLRNRCRDAQHKEHEEVWNKVSSDGPMHPKSHVRN